jgi:hypothetical protein
MQTLKGTITNTRDLVSEGYSGMIFTFMKERADGMVAGRPDKMYAAVFWLGFVDAENFLLDVGVEAFLHADKNALVEIDIEFDGEVPIAGAPDPKLKIKVLSIRPVPHKLQF